MQETIVITASAGSLPGLLPALQAIPAVVEECPLLTFAEPDEWAPVDDALGRLTTYRATVFTSPRAAQAVVQRLQFLGLAWPAEFSAPRVWAGGPATASALEATTGTALMPAKAETGRLGAAGALLRAMLDAGTGSPVLFPCGDARREELPRQLRANGLEVDEVICYRSVLASAAAAREVATGATVLVVTSPRVAELLAEACPSAQRPDLIAVGPTTAESARHAGWLPAAVAELPTAEGVSAAVQSAIAQRCS